MSYCVDCGIDHHAEERLMKIRARAKVLIAYGACAAIGGVHGMKNSFKLDEIMVNAAVLIALLTAAIWVTIVSQSRPSSNMRTTPPSWPFARFRRLRMSAICFSS